MPPDLQAARGTHDLIGEDQRRQQHVFDTARRIAALYGFDEWITPIFEDTRVFSRTLGETSDVVMKEMYSFEHRAGEPITLRPEATADHAGLDQPRRTRPSALVSPLPQRWPSSRGTTLPTSQRPASAGSAERRQTAWDGNISAWA